VDTTPYQGWPNNLRLANGDAELILTLDVGPRVLSYRRAGGANVFAEFPEQYGGTGEPRWMIRGGHRLWLAPEDTTRTYAPDNTPVRATPLGARSVRLTPDPDGYGTVKELDVTLAATGTSVTVVHRAINVGSAPTTLSPWTLSVMAAGGVAVVPLPPKRPHPGPPENAATPDAYAPNQRMIVWPFTDLGDSRWHFGDHFITLSHDSAKGPTKIGLFHRMGWVSYLNAGTLFVKRIPAVEGVPHPDDGVNFELFSNERVVELESLGPLVTLAPGQSAELREDWELLTGVGPIRTAADAARMLPASLGGRG
jgi:hypothetical protein